MKEWKEIKKEIVSIPEEKKAWIEILALLIHEREQQGMTQRDMAEKTGLAQPAIARFESLSAETLPNVTTLIKYVKALGKDIDIK